MFSDIRDLIDLFQTINATKPSNHRWCVRCNESIRNQEMFSYFWIAKRYPERKRAVPRKVGMEQSVRVPPVVIGHDAVLKKNN